MEWLSDAIVVDSVPTWRKSSYNLNIIIFKYYDDLVPSGKQSVDESLNTIHISKIAQLEKNSLDAKYPTIQKVWNCGFTLLQSMYYIIIFM